MNPSPALQNSSSFEPRLRLRTLGRGDGLLGLAPHGPLGPRADAVTVAQVDWTYRRADGGLQEAAAPRTLLSRPQFDEEFQRDFAAEADARDALWASGLVAFEADLLQWRSPEEAPALAAPWTLAQEGFFSAFWLEKVPLLKQAGWRVEVAPGFAHYPAIAEGWQCTIERLSAPRRRGSWLLSLGLEIEGETVDLAPLVADLLRRDSRWLYAEQIEAIEDEAVIMLHAPGGRRIEARAAPLKQVVGAMLDLLTDVKPHEGPIELSDWDAARIAQIDSRAGWQFFGDADLRVLGERLLAAGAPPPVASPEGLGVTLRPYQETGLAWLQYLRAQGLAGILADDMGLGKTAQTLAHVLTEKLAGRLDRPALAVLPSSLLFNWAIEAQRVAPDLKVLVLQGPARAERFAEIPNADLVLTSYPLLWRDLDAYKRQKWHLLILDEAQTVKNAAGRAARAVRRIEARHRLCLTGTPLENHLGELWAQFDFLMPGFLGDARSFQRHWRKPIEEGGESLRAELLAARVRPFVLRRRKDEVATELPPMSMVVRRVELFGAQRELYESVRVAADKQVRRALARADFQGSLITVLDALLKLRQVCCDPRLVKGEDFGQDAERAKLTLLLEMLPELIAEGRRVIVFSQFTEMLALIGAELVDLPHLTLTGDTPVARRAEVVSRFQALEVPLLLASLKAGGLGLNLTAADTVIHFDPWWNPAVQAQASARAHRIGQDRPVFVYQLVVAGSIEERMLELQERKKSLADGVLGSDSGSALKFTVSDLENLLAPLA
ncbi:MAG TPA: DEAD/DEAH box helicase [Burkholderiaceae bacterium]|jgi:superfamily II DNA or RNA helicase